MIWESSERGRMWTGIRRLNIWEGGEEEKGRYLEVGVDHLSKHRQAENSLGASNVVQCFPSTHKALGLIHGTTENVYGEHTCNPSASRRRTFLPSLPSPK